MRRVTFQFVRLSLCVALMAMLSPIVYGQFRAAVQGTVADSAGGVVSGASVVLTSNETQRTQTVSTSDDGFYRFSALAPGSYTLTVEQANFKKQVIENLDVAAENVQGVDIVLTAGGISETVTVTSENTATLETENANTQKTITTEEIRKLPQIGRDPYELLRLAPGIFGNGSRGGDGRSATLPNTPENQGGSNLSVFQSENQPPITAVGQRVTANNYQIDGVSVNSLQYGGAAVITPNQESVKEVLVTATSFSAEDGRNSGAQVKVVSQNGTNDFHGSLVFKYNDPEFNAFNKFFGVPGSTVSRPERVENRFKQYGGSFGGRLPTPNFGEGGPVINSGRDHSFFFFSYEGLRNNSNNTYEAFIETPQYRQQVISARPNGVTAQIFQSAGIEPRVVNLLPRTCAQVFGGAAAVRCRDVAGGLDLGSLTGGIGTYVDDFSASSIGGGFDGVPDIAFAQLANPRSERGNQYNLRFDFNLNSSNQLSLSSYLTTRSDLASDRGAKSRPGSDLRNKPITYVITGIFVSNLSSTMINEFRTNYTSFKQDQVQAAEETNFGIPRVEVEGLPFDRIRFGAERSETTPAIFEQNTLDFNDTLTKVFGNHAVKFGGTFRREFDNNDLSGGARPVYSFVGLINLANDAPIFEAINVDPRTGGIADSQRFFRSSNIAAFVQDDWKILPNLTLNLGLRYEYFSPLTETENRITNLQLGSGARTLLDARVVPVETLNKGDKNNFAPRFGFAYSPNFYKFLENKAVIRGGIGIYHNRIPSVVFSNSRGNPPTFARFGSCCGTTSNPFNNGEIQYYLGSSNSPRSFPRNTVLGGGINPANGLPNIGGAEIYGSAEDVPNAEVYKYSLEMQYELPYRILASVGYEGNQSRNLIRLVNLNFFYETNPNISATFFASPDVNASYNALNARIERRFADGFQITANYRLSKSIDQLSNEGPSALTNQTYPIDISTERGPSDYDSRHLLTVAGVYELPFFRNQKTLLGKLLGGFEISGIMTRHTGFPWTPKVAGNIRTTGTSNTNVAFLSPIRPIRFLGGVNQNTSNDSFLQPNGYFTGGAAQYFFGGLNRDPARFNDPSLAVNPPGIGRNTFRGPNYFSVDMSAAKRFGLPGLGFLGENRSMEIRFNAFNLINNLNLRQFNFFDRNTIVADAFDPGNPVYNPTFGEPTGALSGRVVELQLRFRF
ncbi:MAG: TonB-dependent receptor [Blastocatellia bacterium]|nr:TonB-dependent receptor [Blastocatellia bacterium]